MEWTLRGPLLTTLGVLPTTLLFVGPLVAQYDTKSALTVTVVDLSTEQPIGAVGVKIVDDAHTILRSGITATDGSFVVNELPRDQQVTVELRKVRYLRNPEQQTVNLTGDHLRVRMTLLLRDESGNYYKHAVAHINSAAESAGSDTSAVYQREWARLSELPSKQRRYAAREVRASISAEYASQLPDSLWEMQSEGQKGTAAHRDLVTHRISITGCLRPGTAPDTFLLTRTTGDSGKTAVSAMSTDWTVTGGSADMKLSDHVGHKVRVTGTKEGDQQLRITSMKHVAATCP
jgi:hypothetical protein